MNTLAHSASPFAPTLPGYYCYDQALYALKLERIFSAMWVCIGRADALLYLESYNDEQFNRAAFRLLPVALEVREGLLWLNPSDDPAPLATQLNGPIVECFGDAAVFARYHVGELKLGKRIAYDVHTNWKIVFENFMECYHCGPLHPEFCNLLPAYRSGQIYKGEEAPTLAEGIEAFSLTGKASRPPLPGLLPEDRRRYCGTELEPTVLLSLLGDHVVVHTLHPQAPDRTRVVCDWLFHPEAIAEPDFDPTDPVEVFNRVNHQDWQVCELTQLGMTSQAYQSGGVYVPVEQHIHAHYDFILEKLNSDNGERVVSNNQSIFDQ